jgi:hypothetical protein
MRLQISLSACTAVDGSLVLMLMAMMLVITVISLLFIFNV